MVTRFYLVFVQERMYISSFTRKDHDEEDINPITQTKQLVDVIPENLIVN